jgi:hypothetical protein
MRLWFYFSIFIASLLFTLDGKADFCVEGGFTHLELSEETVELLNRTSSSEFLNTVTHDQANLIFNRFVQNCEISFHYPETGCNVRAYWMGLLLAKQKIASRLIWVELDSPVSTEFGEMDWSFHVAPIVNVEISPGVRVDAVFDPSLFDRFVSVNEFVWALTGKARSQSRVQITRPYYFTPPFRNSFMFDPEMRPPSGWDYTELIRAQNALKEFRYGAFEEGRCWPRGC